MTSFEQLPSREKSKIAFLPIKPVYAEKLINGTKLFEFRRRPMSSDVTHIVVYASSPCKRILGVVEVKSISQGPVAKVWNETREFAGISRREFFDYFSGVDVAYAIAIEPSKTVKLDNQIHPREIEDNFVVPQSFKYVNLAFMQALFMKAESPLSATCG